MEEDEYLDIRREAAMAATPLLEPNYKSCNITEHQINKLKELRRRRLEIKNSSANCKNKKKGIKHNERRKENNDILHHKIDMVQNEDEGNTTVEGKLQQNGDPLVVPKVQDAYILKKKRQKLHWGLDTKERWERKGNM